MGIDTAPQESLEQKFVNFSATLEQNTTRGDGTVEKGESFNKSEIDFGASLEHLQIHHGGEVAGSQFNPDVLSDPKAVEELLKQLLPDQLDYDQFGRAEITLDVSNPSDAPIGWSGVKSIDEIRSAFPDAEIEETMRMPGGEEATEDGVAGAWYPEMARNPDTGRFEVAVDSQGNVKNPKGKFEPRASIATVDPERFKDIAQTKKLTLIIQKDRQTQRPTVMTIFPGENAPMFPAKIQAEDYQADTLHNSNESRYWAGHAFVRPKK
jgi:hypothetical protein